MDTLIRRARAAAAAGGLALAGIFMSTAPVMGQVPADSPVAEPLKKAEAAVQAIIGVPAGERTFDNTVGALDDMLVHLDTDTGMTMFMAYVSTDAKERDAGMLAEQHVANWRIDLFKRDDLYQAVKDYAATNPKLEGEQKKLLVELLRDYKRSGMELKPDQREKLAAIQKEITKLGQEFEKNIREDKTTVPVTKDELTGMSDEYIAALKQDEAGKLLITMDYPTFNPLLEQCRVESTRERVWRAYKRRGGEPNIALIEKILKLRAEAASMLGYASPADYETEVRMAKNAKNVLDFYERLRPIVRRKAKLDLEEYTAAKREETGDKNAKLRPWDQPYYEAYLQRTKYAVDSEKVKEYFPVEACINGLFSVTQSLYGLEYRDVTAQAASMNRPLWHEDVRLFQVWDKATKTHLGDFYVDLYPRENKYNHAACWGLVSRKKWADGSVQKPLAALVCNFPKPTPEKPSLMPHKEVETFFHEFGHCLHNILTEANYGAFAGTNVARDFVEAPSQMFENWVWDPAVLKTFARHYKSGEPIPDDLVAGMIKAKHLGSGLFAERQFYYGLTDMTYHTTPGGAVDTRKVADELFTQIEQYGPVEDIYYFASFGHLIGYQAGYYGYQWSLVYAADMFERFKDQGMLSPEAGMYYRKKILARGSTIDELDMVRDYLGREPKMDAYLEQLGLKE